SHSVVGPNEESSRAACRVEQIAFGTPQRESEQQVHEISSSKELPVKMSFFNWNEMLEDLPDDVKVPHCGIVERVQGYHEPLNLCHDQISQREMIYEVGFEHSLIVL